MEVEVTRALKKDERTSHIPIVLLTAKADAASKVRGLERGADAYLVKPFNKEELLVRIAKLIELRKKMQAYYAKPLPPADDIAVDMQVEDAYIQKVRSIIDAHLKDPQFGVAVLCQEVGTSQPQLYRKIKALTGALLLASSRRYGSKRRGSYSSLPTSRLPRWPTKSVTTTLLTLPGSFPKNSGSYPVNTGLMNDNSCYLNDNSYPYSRSVHTFVLYFMIMCFS